MVNGFLIKRCDDKMTLNGSLISTLKGLVKVMLFSIWKETIYFLWEGNVTSIFNSTLWQGQGPLLPVFLCFLKAGKFANCWFVSWWFIKLLRSTIRIVLCKAFTRTIGMLAINVLRLSGLCGKYRIFLFYWNQIWLRSVKRINYIWR